MSRKFRGIPCPTTPIVPSRVRAVSALTTWRATSGSDPCFSLGPIIPLTSIGFMSLPSLARAATAITICNGVTLIPWPKLLVAMSTVRQFSGSLSGVRIRPPTRVLAAGRLVLLARAFPPPLRHPLDEPIDREDGLRPGLRVALAAAAQGELIAEAVALEDDGAAGAADQRLEVRLQAGEAGVVLPDEAEELRRP